MTLTNYVPTKALFQALIRAKRGVREVKAPTTPNGEPPATPSVAPAPLRA